MANEWQGQEYTYIAANATTLVKTGRGFVHTITIGLPSASTVTVYDGLDAGGTLIGIFVSSLIPYSFTLDATFGVGLTIVTAGTSRVTVTYL